MAEGGLTIVDILNPVSVQVVGTADTPDWARDVAISGNYAYIPDFQAGLQVIEVSDPANPFTAGNVETPGDATGIDLSGIYAFVADGWKGLQVIDISEPETPVIVGNGATANGARDVVVSGDFAYVANAGSGLHVIDISDPTNPPPFGEVDTPGTAKAVDVSGGFAYIADDNYGLQVIDISDPGNPMIVGNIDPWGLSFNDLVISAGYAFIAANASSQYDAGLLVIDISDPANPLVIGNVTTPQAYGVAVSGSTAYITDYSIIGLMVIDILDPANPYYLGCCTTPDFPKKVAITKFGASSGNLMWSTFLGGNSFDRGNQILVDPAGNLVVTGWAGPGFPTTPGAYDESYNAGRNVFVAKLNSFGRELLYSSFLGGSGDDRDNGLALDPLGYVVLGGTTNSGNFPTTPGAYYETWNGGYWDGWVSKLSLSLSDPTAVGDDSAEIPSGGLNLAVHPNPFNPQTIISFTLERADMTEIGVYDLAGRRVRELANQEFSTGSHSLTWNGRDSNGQAVPSGTYLIRIQTESGVQARKVMLVR